MRRLLLATMICGAVIAAAAGPLIAAPHPEEAGESPTDEESSGGDAAGATPIYAERIVVTGSRSETSVLESPVSITALAEEQIDASPADNVADLLRGIAGLNVIQTSARDVSVSGRAATGLFVQGQLGLVDGRSFTEPNGVILWDQLPVAFDEIKQIEILHGPGSAVWGTNALNAVVNVITKSPGEMQGGLVVLEAGEVGTLGVRARWAAAGDKVSYKVSGSYWEQDGWDRPQTLPDGSPMPPGLAFDPIGTEQTKGDVNVEHQVSPGKLWTYRAGFGASTGLLLTQNVPLEFLDGTSFGYAEVRYIGNKVDGRLYWNRVRGESRDLTNDQIFPAKDDGYVLDVTSRQTVGQKHLLLFGGSARSDHFELDLLPNETSRWEVGAYIEDQIYVSSKLQLNLGVRVDSNEESGVAVSPRAGILYQFTPQHGLRASYSVAHRFPTIVENYLLNVSSFSIPLAPGLVVDIETLATGNPDLDAVQSNGAEVGYTGIVADRHTVSATLYRIVLRDDIRFGIADFYGPDDPPAGWPLPPELVPPATIPKTFSFRNVGKVENEGIELQIDSRWSDAFWSGFHYTYQNEPELSDANPLFPILLNLPAEHLAGLRGGYVANRWRASMGVTFTDNAFWTDYQDPRLAGYTDSYTLVDAAIGFALPLGETWLTIRGTNLLGNEVQQHTYGDVIGRKIAAELRIPF